MFKVSSLWQAGGSRDLWSIVGMEAEDRRPWGEASRARVGLWFLMRSVWKILKETQASSTEMSSFRDGQLSVYDLF